MISYLILVLVIAALVATVRIAAKAIEEEYLLVLYWRKHGLWIFERSDDGRYARIALAAFPAALVRYAWRTFHPRPVPVRLPRRTPETQAA